jgi:hypothetical protein
MPTAISFDRFKEIFHPAMPKGRIFSCHACGGSKKQASEKTGKKINCKTCSGHGSVTGHKSCYDPREKLYVEHVAADLRRYCGYVDSDFFEEMCAFMRGFKRASIPTAQPTFR